MLMVNKINYVIRINKVIICEILKTFLYSGNHSMAHEHHQMLADTDDHSGHGDHSEHGDHGSGSMDHMMMMVVRIRNS